jgi:arabinan endo-1,5-alpha-L-arabinosidase
VHDPAILRAGGKFYVFGSHLAAAESDDLIRWKLIDSGVKADNRLIPNAPTEMAEALTWGQSNTFWAGVVHQMPGGKFHFYYCVCKGDSPRSALGLAIADKPEGPYKHSVILLKSGMWNQPSEDGTIYDATIHPNAVDPDVFLDADQNLWMVYGSYSGGIFILRLDNQTGLPLPGQGYGKKLLGGNHSRIEAPAVLYHPPTGYYYLFLSYGGLDSTGGYQIRVARSKTPDGPYVDPQGNDMINAHGPKGSHFADAAIEPFGAKLLGNFQFTASQDPPAPAGTGYVSPGHNSAYFDPATGQAFIVFHTRFPGRGEQHEVRVHHLLINDLGWPVIAPHRYSGEAVAAIDPAAIPGNYQLVRHGQRITPEVTASTPVSLTRSGAISGSATGTWRITGDGTATVTLDAVDYAGRFLSQWDPARQSRAVTFSGLSSKGTTIWLAAVPAMTTP